ncbi:MAG: cytochrome c-type biogenesis protein CcmH [Byssovorax sp.]
MNRRHSLLTLAAALAAFSAAPHRALAQDTMDRSGVLDIRDENERAIFSHLRCTCGCPREAISTCTCGSAAEFRKQVRGMIAQGMTLAQIEAEWVRRNHNSADALMVPPNTGASQLVYLFPLAAIAGMAAVVVTALKRFRKRADEADQKNKGGKTDKDSAGAAEKAAPDAYDDKLDEELSRLDEE